MNNDKGREKNLCFLTAYKMASRPSVLAGTSDSKNPDPYYLSHKRLKDKQIFLWLDKSVSYKTSFLFQVLPDDAQTLLETGNYHKVPIIIGSNSDEGILNLAAYLQGNIHFDEVDEVIF